MTSRSPTRTSLSGDDDRSGDSGVDRGGVSNGSALANAASTRFTISLAAWIDDLNREERERERENRIAISLWSWEEGLGKINSGMANSLELFDFRGRIEEALLTHYGQRLINKTVIHEIVLFSDRSKQWIVWRRRNRRLHAATVTAAQCCQVFGFVCRRSNRNGFQ